MLERVAPGIAAQIETAIRNGQLTIIPMPPEPLFRSNETGTPAPTATHAELAALIQRIQPRLVILDPLSAVAELRDENSNSELGVVAATLANLARAHNTAILLLHHSGKAAAANAPTQHSLRGGSSLAARARWIAILTAAGDTGEKVQLTVVKDSYAKRPPPILFRRAEGGLLVEIAADRRNISAVYRAIRAWLQANPDAAVTVDAIVQHTRGSDGKRLYDALLSAFDWLGNADIRDAVAAGVKTGALSTESVTDARHNRARNVMRPGKGSDYE